MLEKVIRKQSLNKALKELSLELDKLIDVRKHWFKTVKVGYNKIKKNKTLTPSDIVNGIIGCFVVLKMDEEIPNLKKRINRIKKLIKKKI